MARSLVPVAENVWLYPADPEGVLVEPNIGVIVTGKGTVLVDAGNSPRHARRMVQALAAIDAPPVSHVIYTHHHWDHVFGGQVFGAPVIAHDSCRDLLVERAARPWSQAYLEEETRRNPAFEIIYTSMQRAVEDWTGFQIALPTLTFSRDLTLFRGDLTIELEHVGGQHAADSIVVRVPQVGVAFIADCFYSPPLDARSSITSHDRLLVRRLLADTRIDTFIDGHRPQPRSREAFAPFGDDPPANG